MTRIIDTLETGRRLEGTRPTRHENKLLLVIVSDETSGRVSHLRISEKKNVTVGSRGLLLAMRAELQLIENELSLIFAVTRLFYVAKALEC